MEKARKEVPKEICEIAKSLASLVHEIDQEKADLKQFEKKS
jgi:hypothetical protein